MKHVAFHLKNILNSGIGVVVFGSKKFGSWVENIGNLKKKGDEEVRWF